MLTKLTKPILMKTAWAKTNTFRLLVLFLALILTPAGTGFSSSVFNDGDITFNPEYKLKRMSNGDVIIYHKNTSLQNQEHTFTDIYADLLLALYRRQRIEYIENTIAKKYYLSNEECRREIKHAVNVFSEWNIVLREDPIAKR